MGAIVYGCPGIIWGVEPIQPISNAPEGSRVRLRLRARGPATAFVRTSRGIAEHWLFDNHDGTWRLSEPRGINHRL